MKFARFIVCLAMGLSFLDVKAQYTFDDVLYGAAYYHEYMPYDRLDKDIEMMKKAGLSVVRVGESAWGVLNLRMGSSILNGWTGFWTNFMRPASK